ncbi:thioesterase [Micromonospora zingiberis]|uniref:Thioesterase n=1 Tax=Micromonospora zingiberis TaxID=2053011 RepID=A0A4R0G411_9ACTN|nr:alpha/beta fold hydrolase [Micromonospora zingiberis]TCB90059.1 thioesterase [Micromonospora zingiberis]
MSSVHGTPAVADRWIRSLTARSAYRIQLVCFPHAGGTANYFLPLARTLPPEVEVLAVQYPGRQDRRAEPSRTSIAELVDEADAVLRARLAGPYAFFGHSMGAVIAHEVTQRRAGAGARLPQRLFVSGRRAPDQPPCRPDPPRTDVGILADLRAAGGTHPLFLEDAELRAELLRVMRADYQAIDAYAWNPRPPVDCPITALTGDADPQASVAAVRAWSAHTSAGFDLRVFSGGHFYLDEHRPEVATAIGQGLVPMP